MNKNRSEVIFEQNTIEFVTVAAEFCKLLEQAKGLPRKSFVDTVLKILPLLYIKSLLLPKCQMMNEEPATFVTEEDYEFTRINLTNIMGNRDDFLDVYVSDMKYSDQPITCYISENLTDIYQDLKNFICAFQIGINETMNDALVVCKDNFRLYWGQKLVNVLRALHEVYFEPEENEDILA